MLFSSDCLANTVDDEGLEKEGCWGSAGNIGIMLFRPTAIKLAEVGLDHGKHQTRHPSKSCINNSASLQRCAPIQENHI